MTAQEQAIAILISSHDGDDLPAFDLKIVELAVNNNLNPAGLAILATIYQEHVL